MRTKRAETDDGPGRSTLKRVLALLSITFLAGYLLGRHRSENGREAESEDEWFGGTTVEIEGDDDPSSTDEGRNPEKETDESGEAEAVDEPTDEADEHEE